MEKGMLPNDKVSARLGKVTGLLWSVIAACISDILVKKMFGKVIYVRHGSCRSRARFLSRGVVDDK